MKLRSLPSCLACACLAFALSTSTASAQLTDLWIIGADDTNVGDFEHENDGDDFFYVEDGDYTSTNPAGILWTTGPEPWNDGVAGNEIGFQRALVDGNGTINIYFQLDADEAEAGTTFRFDVEFFDGPEPNSHDIELRMNGTPFHTQTVVTDGGAEVLVGDTFLGGDVSAIAGSNVITIERTSGTQPWVLLDYVRLQADVSTGGCEDPICSFTGGPLNIAPGGTASLRWTTDPTATLSIDQGIGNVDGITSSGIGSISVSPTQNTTYTLTSTVGVDSMTAEVTITVGNINSFVALPFQVLPNATLLPPCRGMSIHLPASPSTRASATSMPTRLTASGVSR